MRDRSKMTSAALAFMAQVDEYRKRHKGVDEETAIAAVRSNGGVAVNPRSVTIVAKPVPRAPQPQPRPAVVSAIPQSPPLSVAPPPPPPRKPLVVRQYKHMFKPIEWFGHWEPEHYTTHLLMELGRLGLDRYEIGRRSNGDSVLGDLLDWMGDCGGGNELKLYDWQRLNLELLMQRLADDGHYHRRVKPRISVFAEITSKDNFAVTWSPVGWWESWDREMRRKNCDFLFFDHGAAPFERPRNELMFIRGVGNLRPSYDDYGPYLTYNKPVVDGILICAVRAAYDSLIERLQQTFDVTVRTVFVFEEVDHRVIDWSLEDPEVLQQNADRAAYAAIEQNHGFTVERFLEELDKAMHHEPGTERPPRYKVDEKLTKNLKKAGFTITKGSVEHLRDLIQRVRLAENPGI